MEDFGLVFDEDGNCPMMVGEDFPVNVRRDENWGRLVLSAPVAPELPEGVDYAFMQTLLDFALAPMFDGSPAIGREPESGTLVAYSILNAAELTEASFKEAFEAFVSFAMGMSERLAALT